MLWLLLSLVASATIAAAHDRPIIGVLAQETSSNIDDLFPELNYTSYLPSAYVKFVEAAGARVAPVFIHRSAEYYNRMFSQLNGLLLPGGDSQLDSDGFGAAARAFWQLAHDHPETYFPIWGTCQGMEELAFLAGGHEVIASCHAENQVVTVQLDPDEVAESRLFANASDETLALFTAEANVVMFHSNCVMPDSFSRLADEFRTLGTNQDRLGKRYVSMIEHRTLPLYGVQFHPEKATFEWSLLPQANRIPHWPHAVAVEQYLANFFVSEARRSNNTFSSDAEEQAALIYNYPTYFTGSRGSTIEMCYFFDDADFFDLSDEESGQ